jgi:4-hydroxybenzoate polyprenyltransferase
MARTTLVLWFSAILVAMLAVTTYASLERSILNVGAQLTSDPWFQATLADAYFGFLTFFAWVAYKEPGVWRKLIWFVLIMTLGNIAMSAYVLIQLVRVDRTKGIESILLRDRKWSNGSA